MNYEKIRFHVRIQEAGLLFILKSCFKGVNWIFALIYTLYILIPNTPLFFYMVSNQLIDPKRVFNKKNIIGIFL
jgi:hypothetical protein